MSENEVLAYINAQPEPKRSTMMAVRRSVLEIEPRLEQVIAWKSAMFKFNGKFVAGLCAHKAHLTFSPQSTEVMEAHERDLEGYVVSKGSFQFDIDKPLPKALLRKLIKARLKEVN